MSLALFALEQRAAKIIQVHWQSFTAQSHQRSSSTDLRSALHFALDFYTDAGDAVGIVIDDAVTRQDLGKYNAPRCRRPPAMFGELPLTYQYSACAYPADACDFATSKMKVFFYGGAKKLHLPLLSPDIVMPPSWTQQNLKEQK